MMMVMMMMEIGCPARIADHELLCIQLGLLLSCIYLPTLGILEIYGVMTMCFQLSVSPPDASLDGQNPIARRGYGLETVDSQHDLYSWRC